jgi:hypothetical protein
MTVAGIGLLEASIGAGFGGRQEQLFCPRPSLSAGEVGK